MTPRQAMQRGAIALGTFALVTAGSVAFTRTLTVDRIATHQLAYQHRQLQQVLPSALANTPMKRVLESSFTLPNAERLGLASGAQGWRISDQGRSALVFPVVTRQGYNGEIHLLIGIDGQQRITGVRVTQHQETPGLGDDIELRRSDWITDFDGLDLDSLRPDDWAVDKDGGHFDAFTGATITPRAVVNAVHNALQYAADTPLAIPNEEPGT